MALATVNITGVLMLDPLVAGLQISLVSSGFGPSRFWNCERRWEKPCWQVSFAWAHSKVSMVGHIFPMKSYSSLNAFQSDPSFAVAVAINNNMYSTKSSKACTMIVKEGHPVHPQAIWLFRISAVFWASKSGAKSSMTEEQAVVLWESSRTSWIIQFMAARCKTSPVGDVSGETREAIPCQEMWESGPKEPAFLSTWLELLDMLLHKHQGVRAILRLARPFSSEQDRYPGDLQRIGLLVDEAVSSLGSLGQCEHTRPLRSTTAAEMLSWRSLRSPRCCVTRNLTKPWATSQLESKRPGGIVRLGKSQGSRQINIINGKNPPGKGSFASRGHLLGVSLFVWICPCFLRLYQTNFEFPGILEGIPLKVKVVMKFTPNVSCFETKNHHPSI